MTWPPFLIHLLSHALVLILLIVASLLSVRPASAQAGEDQKQARTDSVQAVADTTAPRIIQPGAPGQPARIIDPSEYSVDGQPTYTEADVDFIQGMILHHAQAVEMTALVEDRAAREDIRRLARRIEQSQDDEIVLMARWLERRGEPLPPLSETVAEILNVDYDSEPGPGRHQHHADHEHDDAHIGMHGMLSEEQMDQLAAAQGEDFDRLFLEFMIYHHEGAIRMVEELFATPGGGQETAINTFASHVESDQRIEIERMLRMLDTY